MKTVLIDSDGVIVDFISEFMMSYCELGGIVPHGFEISHFNAIKELQSKDVLRSLWEDENLFLRASPYPGAIEKLRQLDAVADVFIVTAYGKRADIHVPAKFSWYKEHAPFLKWDQFIFTNQKYMIDGDILIEDKQETVNQWAMLRPDKRVIMVRHPWNHENSMPNVSYVDSFSDVEVL